MKVSLYAAITPNGQISGKNNTTPWSREEWKNFQKFIIKRKNLIIGHNTYLIMSQNDEFEKLEKILIIVLSKQRIKIQKNVLLAKTPKQALRLLKKHKIAEAVVAGGGKTNKSFLKEKLITDIYLDIEPILLGDGINLFNGEIKTTTLKLISAKKYSKNGIQLHYKVVK